MRCLACGAYICKFCHRECRKYFHDRCCQQYPGSFKEDIRGQWSVGFYYIMGLFLIPATPIILVLFPIFFVFFWLFTEDEDLGSSAGVCSYYTRPSVQVISYLWSRGDTNHFMCCIPCPCFVGRDRVVTFFAIIVVVFLWLPIFLALSLIVSAFLGVFGTIIAWYHLLTYILKITYLSLKTLF